ncbi:50S ribosomal protein L11 methyltransferase [Desulfobacterota bacterium M19]
MNPAFSEYTGGGCLHVVVRGNDPRLSLRLSKLPGCRGVERMADDTLVLRAGTEIDIDDFLCRVLGVTTDLGAEIVEAGLGGDSERQEIIIAGFKVESGTAETAAGGPGKRNIILEPGLAFGSGRHPSTRLMGQGLAYINGLVDAFPSPVLDIGCGSGILSVICARLGGRVLGLDINPAAVAGARRNVILNGLEDRVEISSEPIERLKGSFALITANISPFVLFAIVPRLPELLAPGGILIMAGMRDAQMDDLLNILRQTGIDGRRQVYRDGAWRGLLLET